MAPFFFASMAALIPLMLKPACALQISADGTGSDELVSHVNASERVNASHVTLVQDDPAKPEVTAGSRVVAGMNASANATGNPFLAASLQFSWTQALEPVKQKLNEIREWLVARLIVLQDALNKPALLPGVALTEFSKRLSSIFSDLKEKLEPVTSKLSLAGPVMQTVEKVLGAAGYAGAADKFGEVTSEISYQISKYQDMLGNSSQIATELEGLGKSDWHVAGPKIQHLKEILDQGTATIKQFNQVLKEKVSEALTLLSSKLEVDPQMFGPVEKMVGQSWDQMDMTVDSISVGTKTAIDKLPAEVTALPSRAMKCMAALGATFLATAALAL